jgi:hypothetical protein
MKKLLIKIRKLFAPKITEPLVWTEADFLKARRWAKSRLHPEHKNKTIWDVIYSSRKDSVDIIHEINTFIKNEN